MAGDTSCHRPPVSARFINRRSRERVLGLYCIVDCHPFIVAGGEYSEIRLIVYIHAEAAKRCDDESQRAAQNFAGACLDPFASVPPAQTMVQTAAPARRQKGSLQPQGHQRGLPSTILVQEIKRQPEDISPMDGLAETKARLQEFLIA